MKVDYALILAAGKGTRMGAIGQHLPKLLWPVYEKTLLELQILYMKFLGAKKIFINLHHCSKDILQFLKGKSLLQEVTLLREPTLLGVGGAVHNLAREKEVDYKGELLISAGDQFLFLDDSAKKIIAEAQSSYNGQAILLGARVKSRWQHGEVHTDDQSFLRDIGPAPQTLGSHLTYSGLGIIRLSSLTPHKGPSQFFDTVANYKDQDILILYPTLTDLEYYDFGTTQRYFETHFEILENRTPFVSFLESIGAIDPKKISSNSYHSKKDSIINLDQDYFEEQGQGPAIVLKKTLETIKEYRLYYGEYQEEVERNL